MSDTHFRPFTPVSPAAVDALLRCNRAAAQGFEQLTKHWLDTVRQTIERGVEQQRRLSSINTPTDFAVWQNQVAQDSLQNMWARGRELSDLGSNVARDVMASLSDVATETTNAAADQATGKANGNGAKRAA